MVFTWRKNTRRLSILTNATMSHSVWSSAAFCADPRVVLKRYTLSFPASGFLVDLTSMRQKCFPQYANKSQPIVGDTMTCTPSSISAAAAIHSPAWPIEVWLFNYCELSKTARMHSSPSGRDNETIPRPVSMSIQKTTNGCAGSVF